MITKSVFDHLASGEEVLCYRLENAKGSWADILTLGATLNGLGVPDKDGKIRDVVLGRADANGCLTAGGYLGAVIGPSGNRIAGASFTLEGKTYRLTPNEGPNNLHSGPNGFDKKNWAATELEGRNALRLTCFAPDGESGFPGNRKVAVTYELTEDDQICLTYEGESDATTTFNMTNHAYFNLNGEGSGSILSHKLMINARGLSVVADSQAIPTGECAPLEGTVFDFSTPTAIGDRIEADDEQLHFTGGYDHNYVVDLGYEKGKIRSIAKACSLESGIRMEVLTDCPCVQFYAGNGLKGPGKNGHVYGKREGFCLETQVQPNAINTPGAYSPVVKAGEKYLSRTIYAFGLCENA